MAKGNPNIAKEGVPYQFSATNQPANRGRKPSMLKKYMKEQNIDIEDMINSFETLIATHTFDQLKQIMQTGKDRKGKPVAGLVWGFVTAYIKDAMRGFSTGGIFAQILDRKHGKAPQTIKHKTGDVTDVPPAERRKLINELIEVFKNQVPGGSDSEPERVEGSTGGSEKAVKEESGETEKTDS